MAQDKNFETVNTEQVLISDDEFYPEGGSFVTGMTNWADGLSDEEIHRMQLQTDEILHVERIEFRKKGGGSDADVEVDVYDETAESEIGSQTLGGTTKDAGSSGTGNLVTIRLTNDTGGSINASVRVHYRIEGA